MPSITRPRRSTDLLMEEAEAEVVIYNPAIGASAALNAVAAAVLRLCDGTRNVEEITEVIVDVLPAERPGVARDVLTLVTRLTDLGFLTAEG